MSLLIPSPGNSISRALSRGFAWLGWERGRALHMQVIPPLGPAEGPHGSSMTCGAPFRLIPCAKLHSGERSFLYAVIATAPAWDRAGPPNPPSRLPFPGGARMRGHLRHSAGLVDCMGGGPPRKMADWHDDASVFPGIQSPQTRSRPARPRRGAMRVKCAPTFRLPVARRAAMDIPDLGAHRHWIHDIPLATWDQAYCPFCALTPRYA
jgi:hypothetical protein